MQSNHTTKTALVTGASHGSSRELAKQLLENGWTVFGTGDVSLRTKKAYLHFHFNLLT